MSIEEKHRRLDIALDAVGEEWAACGQDMVAWGILRRTVETAAHELMQGVLDEVKEAIKGHFEWDDVEAEDELVQLDVLFDALRERLEKGKGEDDAGTSV